LSPPAPFPLSAPPPPVPLTLISAVFDENEALLTLQFDRAVDISAFVGAAIGVKDGIFNMGQYQGLSASLIGPASVQITLDTVGSYFESNQLMSATPTTGIVAVDDGGTWPGVTDLPLPFP
jgi:hypothetical protein